MKHLKVFFLSVCLCSIAKAEDIFLSLLHRPEPLSEIPANTLVITEEEIKNSNADTVVEILKGKKGLFFKDWNGNGAKVEVDLRGFGEGGASNVLVLLNGHRMNNVDLSNVDWSSIPLSDVERIEVIYGRGTVLYGDNATSGVINIITKKPLEKGINAGIKYGSFSTGKINIEINKSLSERLLFKAGFDTLSSAGFRKNSKTTNSNINTSIFWKPVDNFQINSYLTLHNDSYGLPGKLPETEFLAGNLSWTGCPEDKAVTPLDLNFQNQIKLISNSTETDIDLSYRKRQSKTDYISSGYSYYDSRNTYTNQLVLSHTIDIILSGTPDILKMGIDMFNSKYNIKGYNEQTRTTPPLSENEINRNTLGLYMINKLEISKNTNWTIGYRMENLIDSFKDVITNTPDSVSKSMHSFENSINIKISEILNLGLDYIKSYRFPKTDEFYYFNFLTYSYEVNRELVPQENLQTAINTKIFLYKDLSIFLTVYNLDVKNEILVDPATWLNYNYSATLHKGIETDISFKALKNIEVKFSFANTQAIFKEGIYKDKKIPLVPENTSTINISYKPENNLFISLNTEYAGKRYFGNDRTNSENPLEPYNVTDISISYLKNGYTFRTGINNIFNTKYSSMGYIGWSGKSFYPLPERNIFISISKSFL